MFTRTQERKLKKVISPNKCPDDHCIHLPSGNVGKIGSIIFYCYFFKRNLGPHIYHFDIFFSDCDTRVEPNDGKEYDRERVQGSGIQTESWGAGLNKENSAISPQGDASFASLCSPPVLWERKTYKKRASPRAFSSYTKWEPQKCSQVTRLGQMA